MVADFNEKIRKAIADALIEDIGDGDHTSLATIPAEHIGQARLLIKEDGILAGMDAAQEVVKQVDSQLVFEPMLNDGTAVKKGDIAFVLKGKTQDITIAERLLLNIMQRMSGIATHTHRIQSKIAHTSCRLLDTRKTTPNFRVFEKWAVSIGGGENHRFGLYDMILIKDNHVDFAGGMKNAIQNTLDYCNKKQLKIPIEIEARNMEDVKIIVESGVAFRILLDNFTPEQIREAVNWIDGRILTEASGGINETNVVAYAEAGVDFISMGALTHQIHSLDFSLKSF
ncbi:MAG: carboxylating nicotinate-nucleotide diphosphorylase [Bacteroidota bacterium]|jgi:nicotinate-nucleotide pyrophosphorylase (carboxylating)